MRFRRRTMDLDADEVIDLRERLAPYGDVDADAAGTGDLPPPADPLLAGLTRRVRPLRAEPYKPRHLAT